ncbi:MAG: hypothetical protein AMJ81_03105 [Phycisphaerae bacterium SM23_33]|nr:MAG: hypothetical protein AMJ81_03105 [Phycisphaerae bacterium SM23_33]
MKIMPPPPDRAEELYDLVAKVFSTNGYFQFLEFCRKAYFDGSSYDWAVSRVAESDGRLVGHVGIWRYRMRVGGARLLTGGIGAVGTHADYRRRGVAAACMRAVMQAMAGAGYHYSMLFGLRNFYHRWGFAQAWPNTRLLAKVEDLPDEKLRFTLREVPLTEALCGRGAVMRIYNREHAARTGTAKRPIYTRKGGQWLNAECRTLSDAAGRVRGYLITHKAGDDLQVCEVGGLGPTCGVGQVLAAIRRLAARAGCRRVCTSQMAYNHLLCQALRGCTCSVEMHHTRSGGAMGAVVSLRGCLEAMAGELTERLRRSALKKFRGTLAMEGAGEKVALAISNGSIRVAAAKVRTANRILAGQEIARLLIGSEAPSVLAAQSQVSLHGAATELAEVLFPQQWPMLNQLDHY